MSFSEWKEIKLGELLNFRRGHDLPKTKMLDGNIPVVGSNGIIGFHNEVTTKAPCLTIGRSGNIGNPCYINKDCWAHNTSLYVDDFKGNDPKYLYYLLKTLNLGHYGGGSAVPTLNRNHIHPIEIKATINLAEQKAISHILSTLDDKIEVNNQINRTLENMAQTIFKQWFVDFEFPNEEGEPYKSSGGEMVETELGMIPKGWEVGTIGNYVKVKSGYAFKSAWWDSKGIAVIKIKDINNGTLNLTDCSFVSEKNASSAQEFIINGGEILIAMTGATIGKFAIVPKMNHHALVNQRVGKFFLGENPFDKVSFLYCILNQSSVYEEIVSRGDGSAQPNISPSGIESIKIVIPNSFILDKFNRLMKFNFQKITENIYENNKLVDLRDTLLPKLMSGEIRVPLDEEGEAS